MSKGNFAKLCGVTYEAIKYAMKDDGPLKDAAQGAIIDANHPDAVAYMMKHFGAAPILVGGAAIKNAKKTTDRQALPTEEQMIERGTMNAPRGVPPIPYVGGHIETLAEDVRAFAGWTLRDLIAHFGSDFAFVDWLKAYKAMEDIHAKQLANAETEGELIHRDLVEKVIFGNIETMTVRLLTDGSKTIARKVFEMAKAGRTVEECERFVADQITSFVAPMKDKMKKGFS